MPLVATLVSRPADRALSLSLANMASRSVGASAVVWLAEGIACDLVLPSQADAADATAACAPHLPGEPVDVIVQQAETRRKKILIADMDSTMIDQECIDELADEIGVKDRVATITARSMNGEIAFEPALRERVALLKGLDAAVVDRIVANRLTLASGGRALVQTMRANGACTALVSGGFEVFTTRIAAMLGFQENRAKPPARAGRPLHRAGRRTNPRPRRQGRRADRNFSAPRPDAPPTPSRLATAPMIST